MSSICTVSACFVEARPDGSGLCNEHRWPILGKGQKLVPAKDLEEVEALRIINDDLQERLEGHQKRSQLETAAAVSFAIAGGACALGIGAGTLGVVFVAGCVAGITCLIKSVR